MGEVPAMAQVEPHEGIARIKNGQEYRHVGLCPGVGLHVGILGTIELAKSVYGQVFHFINHLTAPVVAMSRVAFCILVGQAGTHGFHHLHADKVFRGDQFNAPLLPLLFVFDKLKQVNISIHLL
jgi:hypothetical protein